MPKLKKRTKRTKHKIKKPKKTTVKDDYSFAKDLLGHLFNIRFIQIAIVALVIIIALPFIAFYIYRPIFSNHIQYGVNFSNKYAEEMGLDWQVAYIKILDDLQPDNLRLVAYWSDIESERDQFDYSDLKWQVEEAEKRDIGVILAMGKKVPRWPECFEPEWWQEIEDEEIRDLELLEYIKQTVNEFDEYENIMLWQVENEPFFPFGECSDFTEETLEKEIALVRSLDDRPILVQDSGEGGFWLPTYQKGDYLAISMYRKIWYDFWGVFLRRFIYFTYPLPYWSYQVKAGVLQIPHEKIMITELQAEPWGPGPNHLLTDDEKKKTMSRNDFISTISYAQKSGFKHLYFWGAEWWLWEKEVNDNPFYWDTAKALFN